MKGWQYRLSLNVYDHDVYLNIEEKLCNDKEDIREPPPKLMKKTHKYWLKILHIYYYQQGQEQITNTCKQHKWNKTVALHYAQSPMILKQSSIVALLSDVLWMLTAL